jgi:tetratricopeptide (TPR) repeat protein/transcriptional regulator with XRE-family HTH domain
MWRAYGVSGRCAGRKSRRRGRLAVGHVDLEIEPRERTGCSRLTAVPPLTCSFGVSGGCPAGYSAVGWLQMRSAFTHPALGRRTVAGLTGGLPLDGAMPRYVMQDADVGRRRLAQRRRTVGLTQESLAELLAVERSTVVRWERGQTDPLPLIRPKLARALGVSADGLESLLAGHRRLTGVVSSAQGPGQDVRAGVPRQLPTLAADFTGRAGELGALTQVLDAAECDTAGTVVISAIGGMAGVGKTALALHWAHQAAQRFPDGQLYVNLRGFDRSGSPVSSAEAVRWFLGALGVTPDRVPASPEEQAGLYRSLLAGRRVLIVLDNAQDEQQVRPLLPACPGTLVLVTSRRQLIGLAAADGARLLSLDVLSHCEARDLLWARLGQARAAAEPEAVVQIALLCGYLPLALTIAAARAAARPQLPLAAVADELRSTPDRLRALEAGDPAASVQAVFSWSYHQLSPDAARLFRLLGLHPGPDVTAAAAASLAGVGGPGTRKALGELVRMHLVAECSPGRYVFHDLVRAYAADQARTMDSEASRREAVGRVMDHYVHTAQSAAIMIRQSVDPVTVVPPRPGVTPEDLADHQQAQAWLEAEHQVLLAAIALADSSGFDVHAWQIPWTLAGFLLRHGYWQENARIQGTALAAATRLADPTGQATALANLARACSELGDYEQAEAHHAASLKLYTELGDNVGQAKVLGFLALAADRQGRYAEGLSHCERALRLYRAAGHRRGEAFVLSNLGWARANLGDYEQARTISQQALALSAELGVWHIEAHAWDSLGYAEQHLGNVTAATACYEQAIHRFREFDNLPGQAQALTRLGDTHHANGELPQALGAWEQALDILVDLDGPQASEVRSKLVSTKVPHLRSGPLVHSQVRNRRH